MDLDYNKLSLDEPLLEISIGLLTNLMTIHEQKTMKHLRQTFELQCPDIFVIFYYFLN